jgi:hypothetical protein
MSELHGTGGAAAIDGGTVAAATRETDSSGGYPDDGSGGYSGADIEAILAADDRLPEPRTRQDAAADTWGDSADGNTDSEPAIGDDSDLDAQLAMEEHLPESRTRQEAAADTWGDASPGSRPGHPDIRDRYPSDYKLATDAPPPQIDGSHTPAEEWASAINPDKQVPERRVNCGDCSRSVDSTWHGFPAVAAAVDYPRVLGEDPARMTEWAGTRPRPVSMADIGKQLGELGPGSSAIVGCDWKTGRGHWFNAVNDSGTVKAVDGQSGKVEAWPPTRPGLGFDESRMRYSDAIFFTPDGKVVPH